MPWPSMYNSDCLRPSFRTIPLLWLVHLYNFVFNPGLLVVQSHWGSRQIKEVFTSRIADCRNHKGHCDRSRWKKLVVTARLKWFWQFRCCLWLKTCTFVEKDSCCMPTKNMSECFGWWLLHAVYNSAWNWWLTSNQVSPMGSRSPQLVPRHFHEYTSMLCQHAAAVRCALVLQNSFPCSL